MAALTNPHWETYAQQRAAGLSQRKAYRVAYPKSEKSQDATVDNKAYLLEKKGEIRARYMELMDEAAHEAGGAVMTRNEKRELLAKMARDETLSARERQSAIDLDNKMENEYKTVVEADLNMTKLEDLI